MIHRDVFSGLSGWEHPVVVLKDVTHQELRLLLTFVYTGTVNLPEGRVERFLEAGRSLQIEGIAGDTRLVQLGSAKLLTTS